jgi:hypothetical protein
MNYTSKKYTSFEICQIEDLDDLFGILIAIIDPLFSAEYTSPKLPRPIMLIRVILWRS